MPTTVDLNNGSGIVGMGSGRELSPLDNSVVGTRIRAGRLGALALIQAETDGDMMIRGLSEA
jgi:hypothetical protein